MPASRIAGDPAHPSNAVQQPPTLKCGRCVQVFYQPFDENFFRDRNGPFGWRRWCKACYSEAPCMLRRAAERRSTRGVHG